MSMLGGSLAGFGGGVKKFLGYFLGQGSKGLVYFCLEM